MSLENYETWLILAVAIISLVNYTVSPKKRNPRRFHLKIICFLVSQSFCFAFLVKHFYPMSLFWWLFLLLEFYTLIIQGCTCVLLAQKDFRKFLEDNCEDVN